MKMVTIKNNGKVIASIFEGVETGSIHAKVLDGYDVIIDGEPIEKITISDSETFLTQDEFHKICHEYGLKMVYHKNEFMTETELRDLCEFLRDDLLKEKEYTC